MMEDIKRVDMKARKLIITEAPNENLQGDDSRWLEYFFLLKKEERLSSVPIMNSYCVIPCRICIQVLLWFFKTLTMPFRAKMMTTLLVGHILLQHLSSHWSQKTFVCHYWSFTQGWGRWRRKWVCDCWLLHPAASRAAGIHSNQERLDGAPPSIGIAFLGCD